MTGSMLAGWFWQPKLTATTTVQKYQEQREQIHENTMHPISGIWLLELLSLEMSWVFCYICLACPIQSLSAEYRIRFLLFAEFKLCRAAMEATTCRNNYMTILTGLFPILFHSVANQGMLWWLGPRQQRRRRWAWRRGRGHGLRWLQMASQAGENLVYDGVQQRTCVVRWSRCGLRGGTFGDVSAHVMSCQLCWKFRCAIYFSSF